MGIELKNNIENLFDKVDRHNERTEESHKKSLGDMAECMAEDLYKPICQAIDGETTYLPSFGYSKKYANNYDLIDWSKT